MKRWRVLGGSPREVGPWLDTLEQETQRLKVVSATTTIDVNGHIYLTVLVSYWEDEEE